MNVNKTFFHKVIKFLDKLIYVKVEVTYYNCIQYPNFIDIKKRGVRKKIT